MRPPGNGQFWYLASRTLWAISGCPHPDDLDAAGGLDGESEATESAREGEVGSEATALR
jgi:hypothetical protein